MIIYEIPWRCLKLENEVCGLCLSTAGWVTKSESFKLFYSQFTHFTRKTKPRVWKIWTVNRVSLLWQVYQELFLRNWCLVLGILHPAQITRVQRRLQNLSPFPETPTHLSMWGPICMIFRQWGCLIWKPWTGKANLFGRTGLFYGERDELSF